MIKYDITGFTQNELKMFYNKYKRYISAYDILIDNYIKCFDNNGDFKKVFSMLSIFSYIINYLAYKSKNNTLFILTNDVLDILSKKNIEEKEMKLLYEKIKLIRDELVNYTIFLSSRDLDIRKKINILIIDDDDLAISVLTDKIKQIDVETEVDIALNSDGAINRLMYSIENTGDIHDLFFIDIVMPQSDYNGITLLKLIRSIEDYALNKVIRISKDYYYKYKPIIIHSDFIKSYEDLIKHIHTNDIELVSKEECSIDLLKNIFKKYDLI